MISYLFFLIVSSHDLHKDVEMERYFFIYNIYNLFPSAIFRDLKSFNHFHACYYALFFFLIKFF
ncbi:hypothetical protein C1646_725096 [Rhizophagus diaphanus]|nr:hypothetical protein C1646_725096 [Rhizophagus diaphanus] [Rhizophagus sp. MUCL 43196]